MAVSRPEPGPDTLTSTLFMPCSSALRAHCSAATCAANGVPFRLPLKLHAPALDQQRTAPVGSVIETRVLLKDDRIKAIPSDTCLRSFDLLLRVCFLAMGFVSCDWFGPRLEGKRPS